jgi:sarcosine oxidase
VDYDVAVIGLGAVGTSVSYQLARRGAKVVGIDQYKPPHNKGSSHGESRIMRLAMAEGAPYGQLAMRSHELWQQIENDSHAQLFINTGCLIIGQNTESPPSYVCQTISAASANNVEHRVLRADAIRQRFPLFRITDADIGYFEPMAGLLRPHICITAQEFLARRHGAHLRTGERTIRIEGDAGGVRVTTDRGIITAAKGVISAGPWLPSLLEKELAYWFRIYRQVQFWFAPNQALHDWRLLPAFIWELGGEKKGLYGLPGIDGGAGSIKVASEQYEIETTAMLFQEQVSDPEIAAMRENFLRPFLPTLDGACTKAVACMYTTTPDEDFLVDYHPYIPDLIVASPCSGHGFKHSPAVGEAIAELILTGTSTISLKRFKLDRFGR